MELLERLKELGVYEQFMRNCRNYYKLHKGGCYSSDTVSVLNAFDWAITPEGQAYWCSIAIDTAGCVEVPVKTLVALLHKLPKCYREL